jgi:glycoprotein endo-alpha-1,2-mannosidase
MSLPMGPDASGVRHALIRPLAIAVAGVSILSGLLVGPSRADALAAPPATRGVTGVGGVMAPTSLAPLVGAYYSDWFPKNSVQGTLRQHLIPAQGADPTKVQSSSPAVADLAIAQAARAGISFFALDYWPSRPAQNKNIDAFVRAKDLGDIKFCIFYETWDLGFDAPLEATPVTPAMEATFDANLLRFARTYFTNPDYLRLDGRPVLVLYLTRTLTGDVGGMISQAGALLRRHGYNPYLIGDEIFWRVTSLQPPSGGISLTQTPQTSRIDAFDAITSYSLYVGDLGDPLAPWRDFVGYPGTTSIVADETALYRRYAAASGGSVPVIPDVTPGENTRGVRLSVNEPAEPRQWLPGEGSGSTLEQFLDQIARPVLNPQVPIVFVTTWNEWNEDTAIEPIGGTPTAKDDSPSGTAYTQGYTYGGEGSTDLNVIRDFVSVAWGQLRDGTGKGVAGVEVDAIADERIVSRARTDFGGWYVLPRTSSTSGTLVVSAAGYRTGRPFQASAGTSTRVDLSKR